MKKSLKIMLILSLVLHISCGTKKESQTPVVNGDRKEQYPQAIIGEFSKSNDPYKIKSIKLERNYVIIEVTYSGGCEVHDFQLIGSKFLSKSIPAIRNVQLVHNKKNDSCKKLVTEKLKFSISVLAQNYEPGNKVELLFDNYPDKIPYSYE
ncbi:MAG: hypothetical protein V4622_02530 [Bacteroidota bacterium]